MAKSMPGIIIKIGANTKDAIDGLNKVNRALGQSATGTQRFTAAMRKAGPALGLAAAGAGLLAVKMGVDAVQAAMEEEKSVKRLAQTLTNLGMATEDAGVEKFVDNMQFATGIADNDLRPAMDRLVRSTGDVATAQQALAISADIAVAKGRNVTDVANILGKAYDGNTMALGRLGVGLDKSILKTGDMGIITKELARLFSGQAAGAADTLAGRMAIAQIAVDELSEALGLGLVSGFTGAGDSLDDFSKRMRDMQPQVENMGKAIGGMVASALDGFTKFGLGAMKLADAWDDAGAAFTRFVINTRDWAGEITDEQADAERTALDMADAQREAAMRAFALGGAQQEAATETNRMTTAAESNARTMDRQKSAADKLKASLDKLNGRRSVMQQRFDLANMLSEGPGKSGSRKGADGKMTQFTTLKDRKEFAFNVADSAAGLADSLKKGANKREALADAREAIRGMNLPGGFKSDLLDTLTPAARQRTLPGTPQTGQQVAGINYNFYGGINVTSSQAAQQAAKEARRLAALSGSRYAGMAETGRGY